VRIYFFATNTVFTLLFLRGDLCRLRPDNFMDNTKLNSDQSDEVTQYLLGRFNQIRAFLNYTSCPIIIKCPKFQVLQFTVHYYDDHTNYASIYLYDNYREKGAYKNLVKSFNKAEYTILIMEGCGLEGYLKYIGVDHEHISYHQEYKIISKYYEGKFAQRSGLSYMNHIHEGCYLLHEWSDKLAFMLHPIYQNGDQDKVDLTGVDQHIKTKAAKYAEVANSYLPKDWEKEPPKIPGSVWEMLKADKIQNYKDFLDNKDKIDQCRHEELETYFNKWFQKLKISRSHVNIFVDTLKQEVPIV